jgi:uncharacterized protein (DUF1015 family)
MANIKEFRGLRPVRELAHLVAELPYDVVDSREARSIASKNENSFFHISKPEVDLPEHIDVYDDMVYKTGRANLNRFIQRGLFHLDESPMFYLYTLIMDGREQTGLVACIDVDDYINNIILRHEHTRKDKELDRARHIDALNAQTGLVLLLYRENGEKRELFKNAFRTEPEYDFTSSDGVRHVFRVLSDVGLKNSFKDVFKDDVLYIADGHHRAASAVRVALDRKARNSYSSKGEHNWFLAVIFPHEQLNILPYNRVVRDLNNLSENDFLDRLSENYILNRTNERRPNRNRRFSMYLEGKWYSLVPRFKINSDTVESLDVQILQDTILGALLGIEDPRIDQRIGFVGGVRGIDELERLVDSKEYRVAFSLFPTSIDELIKVSDAGRFMPPKSTWFEPKLRSGLVLHLL